MTENMGVDVAALEADAQRAVGELAAALADALRERNEMRRLWQSMPHSTFMQMHRCACAFRDYGLDDADLTQAGAWLKAVETLGLHPGQEDA